MPSLNRVGVVWEHRKKSRKGEREMSRSHLHYDENTEVKANRKNSRFDIVNLGIPKTPIWIFVFLQLVGVLIRVLSGPGNADPQILRTPGGLPQLHPGQFISGCDLEWPVNHERRRHCYSCWFWVGAVAFDKTFPLLLSFHIISLGTYAQFTIPTSQWRSTHF